jgi:hypothetical protein
MRRRNISTQNMVSEDESADPVSERLKSTEIVFLSWRTPSAFAM